MKKNWIIIAVVVVGVAIAIFWLKKREANQLKEYLLSWAQSEVNPDKAAKLSAMVSQMSEAERKTLQTLVRDYFNAGVASIPVELQQFWNATVSKYGI